MAWDAEKWQMMSWTIRGLLMAAASGAGLFGIVITESEVDTVVTAAVAAFGAIGVIVSWVGRFRASTKVTFWKNK